MWSVSRLSADLNGTVSASAGAPAGRSVDVVVLGALVAIAVVTYRLARQRTLAEVSAARVRSGIAERLETSESLLRHTPQPVQVRKLSGRYLLVNEPCLSKPVRVEALRAALEGVVAMSPPIAARETKPALGAGGAPSPGAEPAPQFCGHVPATEAATTLEPAQGAPTASQDDHGTSPDDDAPAVDVSALTALVRQLDPRDTGLRDVLLTSYLDEGSTQMSRLLMAATTSDLPTVIAMSHTLRSTSALLGATKLASLLQSTEDAARGDSTQLMPFARRIDVEHARVVIELNRLRSPVIAVR